jgi:hypothetical protein
VATNRWWAIACHVLAFCYAGGSKNSPIPAVMLAQEADQPARGEYVKHDGGQGRTLKLNTARQVPDLCRVLRQSDRELVALGDGRRCRTRPRAGRY